MREAKGLSEALNGQAGGEFGGGCHG
jgi:hypothetical protein